MTTTELTGLKTLVSDAGLSVYTTMGAAERDRVNALAAAIMRLLGKDGRAVDFCAMSEVYAAVLGVNAAAAEERR